MNTHHKYELLSLKALQEFANILKERLSEPFTIKKNPEEDSVHFSTDSDTFQLQIIPRLHTDITESYHIKILTITEEFEVILDEILDIPKKKPIRESKSIFTRILEMIKPPKK